MKQIASHVCFYDHCKVYLSFRASAERNKNCENVEENDGYMTMALILKTVWEELSSHVPLQNSVPGRSS